jgi:hypothetical protein
MKDNKKIPKKQKQNQICTNEMSKWFPKSKGVQIKPPSLHTLHGMERKA